MVVPIVTLVDESAEPVVVERAAHLLEQVVEGVLSQYVALGVFIEAPSFAATLLPYPEFKVMVSPASPPSTT